MFNVKQQLQRDLPPQNQANYAEWSKESKWEKRAEGCLGEVEMVPWVICDGMHSLCQG